MTNIYQLPQEIEKTLEIYYSSWDEDGVQVVSDEELQVRELALFELQNQKTELLEWYLKSRANKLALLPWIQEEIKRLSAIVTKEQKKVDRIERILDHNFSQMFEGKPLAIGNFSVSYRKSEAVLIENEEEIPNDYKKEKLTVSIDKTAIKEALKEWKAVQGASIEVRQNLQIK